MRNSKILIVEDEIMVAEYLSAILDRLGYQVLGPVSSGEKALQQLAVDPANLVLLDLKLQGELDGVEIARMITATLNIPVVFLTAYADPGTLERIKSVAPYGYLIKPVREDDLYRTIEISLHKYQFDQALRANEERFRIVADFAYDWEYWISPEHTILYISPSCQRISGYAPQEFIKDPDLLVRIVHPEDRSRFEDHMRNEFTQDAPVRQEFRILHADGGERWIGHHCQPVKNSEGKFLGRRTSNRDITMQIKEQQELQLFKTIIESSSEAIQINGPDGRPVYLNPAHIKLLGRGLEEARKCELEDLHPPESIQILAEKVYPAIVRGESWEGVLDMLDNQGRRFPIWARTGVTFDQQGKHINTYVFLHDVTRERQAQEALIDAQKVASLGTFAAGMAHELNSPLQVITGISERLLESLNKGEAILEDRLKRGLEAINRNAWRSADMIRALFTYTQIAESLFAPHDLNTIVQEALKEIQSYPGNWDEIDFRLELMEGMPLFTCDRRQIHQILAKLIENARDAMPLGGEITIRTGYDPENRLSQLEVKDQGTGIPLAFRDRIFDPFFTTKPVGSGTGLGLPIVMGMVRLHGGRIEFDSEIGKGTTFWLNFPDTPTIHEQDNTSTDLTGRFPYT